MKMQQVLNVVVEGQSDEPVITSILRYLDLSYHHPIRIAGGKATLMRNLQKYNQAAQHSAWLVVVDLDQEPCSPGFIANHIPQKVENLLLRVAVREVEAWLLADSEHLSKYLGITTNKFPHDPDNEPTPKEKLFALAKLSRNKRLREDIIPRPQSGAKAGPGYPTRISEFIWHSRFPWRPAVAAQHSESLRRCIKALKQWQHKPPL